MPGQRIKQLKLMVPTYNYSKFPGEVDRGELEEFGAPKLPVLVREAEGVRIVLGSHDYEAMTPDVQIERQPDGWMIFLHPCAGSDACGYLFFMDNGQSYLKKERPYVTPEIKILECYEDWPSEKSQRSGLVVRTNANQQTHGEVAAGARRASKGRDSPPCLRGGLLILFLESLETRHMHSCGRCRIPSTNRGYWQRKISANAKRDRKAVRRLRAAGWSVLVIWECQTTVRKLARLQARLMQFFELSQAPAPRAGR